jgi:very-short-patch-repair endonuclease
MRPIPRSRWVDRLIAHLAARQHGVVARWQLIAAGITAAEIKSRKASGRLEEIDHGVYLVGAVAPALAHEQAALLAYRNEAVLSHHTATALWRLTWRPGDSPPSPASTQVWLTLPPGRGEAKPRFKLHRANLDRRDIRGRHRLALTSPPRTILDMSLLLDEMDLEQLVAEAHYRRLAGEAELRDQLRRNPGKRGAARLRRVLGLAGGPQRTRSHAERWMLTLLRQQKLTGFEMNAEIAGYEVDALWRDLNFAIEIDGWDAHSGRAAFERDRLKRATLTAYGLSVMPVTGRQIREDPVGVARRVRDGLAARGSERR